MNGCKISPISLKFVSAVFKPAKEICAPNLAHGMSSLRSNPLGDVQNQALTKFTDGSNLNRFPSNSVALCVLKNSKKLRHDWFSKVVTKK